MSISSAHMSRPETIDGYVADSVYPSAFHGQYDPTWVDAVLEIHGIKPPRQPRASFNAVDLGCGDGIGTIATAAGHPEGQFAGVDAHDGHIAHGQAFLAASGITNVALHQGTFAEPPAIADGSADYVTAQGVLAWVSPANRAHLIALAARLLKPGGVLVVGYNTMPGWQAIAPYQRLVRALAEGRPGSPEARYASAREQLRTLGLVHDSVWEWLDAQQDTLDQSYLPHEYLNGHWEPQWSCDTVRAFADTGLHYVCDSLASGIRPDLTLKASWRETLSRLDEPAAREAALDLLINRWFRNDIYIKGTPVRLDPAEQRERRLARHWMLGTPNEVTDFSARTPAGTIRFDNATARAILAHLQDGPAPLGSVAGPGEADLINTADALFIARLIRPCDSAIAADSANLFNEAVRRTGISINAVAGRHGTVPVERGFDWTAAPDAHARLLGLSREPALLDDAALDAAVGGGVAHELAHTVQQPATLKASGNEVAIESLRTSPTTLR